MRYLGKDPVEIDKYSADLEYQVAVQVVMHRVNGALRMKMLA